MRIIDPTFGTSPSEEPVAVAGGRAPAGTFCLFSNSKPGANELLRGVAHRLEAERGFSGIAFASKPSASVPADSTVIDRLAAQYRTVLLATGD
jgi:hypothetical protein